ncbi:MAG: hypothetical protein ACMUIA_01090 [bacterium]
MKRLLMFMILFTIFCIHVKAAQAFDYGAPFGPAFDASRWYSGVNFLSGPVAQDTDWNSGWTWGNAPMFASGMGWGLPAIPAAPWSGGSFGPNFQSPPYFQNSSLGWGSAFPQGTGNPLNSWGGFTPSWPIGNEYTHSFDRIADSPVYLPNFGSSYSNWGNFNTFGYQNAGSDSQFRTMSFPRWNYEDMMDEHGHPVYRGAHSSWW